MSMARVERVEAQIKQAVGRILHGELRDPRVGFLTVIRVSVSADLQHAHVYVSCLGADGPGDCARLRASIARPATADAVHADD
jgi:ribosome-binding factor A